MHTRQQGPDTMHTSIISTLTHLRIIAICILVISTAACASAAITVTDDTGATVTIESPPQRIVSLSPSNTEVLYALGLGDRVVGVTEYCNYPPEAVEKQKIGGYSTVSIEKVIALKPDLIVASYGNGDEVLSNLRSFGFPVVTLHPGTLAGVLADIRLVGRATGVEEDANRLAGDLERRISNVEARVGTAGDRPAVAHVIWNDPIYVSGNATFQDELIMRAGGVNAFSHLDGWKNIGIEDFIQADPDVLIVNAGSGMGGGEDSVAEFFMNEPRFSRVTAIRENHVYIVDSDMVDRAGPRIVDALELFAEDIHPGDRGSPAPTDIPGTKGNRMPGFGTLAATGALSAVAFLALRRFG